MQPTIAFDIDGTLTDYRKFIRKTAFPYFEKKYGMKAVALNELEPEDIFKIKECLLIEGLSDSEAEDKTKKIIKKFWVSPRFLKFSFMRYRSGVRKFVKELKKKGFSIEFHTSRSMSTQKSIVGFICRLFTILQSWLNGILINPKKVHFYLDDESKVHGLVKLKPVLIFEDKPAVIKELSAFGLKVIRVSEQTEQSDVESSSITGFDSCYVFERIYRVYGQRNWDCIEREASSDSIFRRIIFTGFFIGILYRPIVLNSQRFFRGGDRSRCLCSKPRAYCRSFSNRIYY